MPSQVDVKNIGDPEPIEALESRLKKICEPYPDTWRVRVTGAADNDIWQVRITKPNGPDPHWKKDYGGQNGEHVSEKIVEEVERDLKFLFDSTRKSS